MINLEIRTMQIGEFELLVQLDMEDLFTRQTLVTFGYHQPADDIIVKLKQQIDADMDTLYQVIAEQPGRGHTVSLTATPL